MTNQLLHFKVNISEIITCHHMTMCDFDELTFTLENACWLNDSNDLKISLL